MNRTQLIELLTALVVDAAQPRFIILAGPSAVGKTSLLSFCDSPDYHGRFGLISASSYSHPRRDRAHSDRSGVHPQSYDCSRLTKDLDRLSKNEPIQLGQFD